MSGLKTKEFTIDGERYQITQLGAIQGRKLWLKLLHVLAPTLKELAKHETFDQTASFGALAALVEGLDESTAEELYTAFGPTCRVHNGEKWPTLEGPVFDVHFAGKYLAMTKWLGECVMFNFADFLGDMSIGSIAAMTRAGLSKSTSPKVSTGISGESSLTNAHPSSPT